MKNVFILSGLLLISCSAFAIQAPVESPEKSTDLTNTTLSQTNNSDSTANKTTTLDVDKFSAEFWGLTSAEWARYKLVKTFANQLGNKSSDSTPLEVLAIFADNEKDRMRYAKLLAEKLDIYANNLLAADRALEAVQATMYANTPMISQKRLNALTDSPMKESDRVQLFTTTGTDFPTELLLRQLIREARNYGNKLDVFVRNSNGENLTDKELQNWAAKHIPTDLAKSGQITINHDGGFSKKHHLSGAIAFVSHNNGPLKIHVPNQ